MREPVGSSALCRYVEILGRMYVEEKGASGGRVGMVGEMG
jgi:hypothetical protein